MCGRAPQRISEGSTDMHDESAFLEMMQRYNRELLQLQQRARPGGQQTENVPLPPDPNPGGGCAPAVPGNHSQTVGDDGPVLVQDGILHERLETFVHQKGIERAVHTKGYGALGTFQTYQSMREYTKAAFLQGAGRRTKVLVRFSLAVSNRGTPDTARNVHGFATRFYTDEGNFDIVGNHIPVFFIRDAMRFPETIAALSPSPQSNLADPGRFWDYLARTPEGTHMLTWLYSDVGTLASVRHMRGFGINTFVWVNAEGRRRYIKYHWIPLAGEEYLDRQQAGELAAKDPDAAARDLYDALANGEAVEYELCVQMMDPCDAQALPFDPLDDTKVWSEESYPLIPVGKMTLDQNPEDYHTQVEQVAFSPANLVEGIELSADKMLQGRSFIYWDAQRRRLGPDFRGIPVNRQQGGWSPQKMVTSGQGLPVAGELVRADIQKPDDFTQAGERYRSLSADWQERLVDNIASELYLASQSAQECVLGYLSAADAGFGERVRARMEEYKQK